MNKSILAVSIALIAGFAQAEEVSIIDPSNVQDAMTIGRVAVNAEGVTQEQRDQVAYMIEAVGGYAGVKDQLAEKEQQLADLHAHFNSLFGSNATVQEMDRVANEINDLQAEVDAWNDVVVIIESDDNGDRAIVTNNNQVTRTATVDISAQRDASYQQGVSSVNQAAIIAEAQRSMCEDQLGGDFDGVVCNLPQVETPEPQPEPSEEEETFDFDLLGLSYRDDACGGYYAEFCFEGKTDDVVDGEGIRITMYDPTGFYGNTHGTRTAETLLNHHTTGEVVQMTTADAWYAFEDYIGYYSVEGPLKGKAFYGEWREGVEFADDSYATLVDHYLATDGELGIYSKSWDHSPAMFNNNLDQYIEGENGVMVHRESQVEADIIARGNSLLVSSMENNDAASCAGASRNGQQIRDCGETDSYIVLSGVGLGKSIFVSTTAHQSWASGDVWESHVVRVDMNALGYAGNENTTSHATPIVAAAAAHLAEAKGITSASALKNALNDFVNQSTRIIDIEAIFAL